MGFQITLRLEDSDGESEWGFDYASAEIATKVADWAESIPDDRFSAIKSLFINGQCPDSAELSVEIGVALKSFLPKDREVTNKLKYIAKEIGLGVPGERVYIEE